MSRWTDLGSTVRIAISGVGRAIRPLAKWTVRITGVIALVMVVLACTRIPFDLHQWLGTAAGECDHAPEVLVILGGSGMPSGPELLRLHRAAELAMEWPEVRIAIIDPGAPSILEAMTQELEVRGVDRTRMTTMNVGNNTREQALLLEKHYGAGTSVALVTAPENVYRSVRAFRKLGFEQVCGVPAWDHASAHDFAYGHKEVGGRPWAPDVSNRPGLRYTFWNYLKLEITCLREYVAILYYQVNGWI
ncbi:MAG: YdcF family protein [Flavobacteriales bacterium]|nr:YdcF family protein [Flavobacteriales bacterium]